MKINSSFNVDAPPDKVFAYLLDVNKVVSCVPGAELTAVVDSKTFKGKMKMKLGAVQLTYQGTATILNTEERPGGVTITMEAKGSEIKGQGTARALVGLTIAQGAGGGSVVTIDTDLSISGKAAQFGRGLIDDVSATMVDQMSQCISANLRNLR